MPLQYPLNQITAPRVEHFIGKASGPADLRSWSNLRDAQLAAVRGLGVFGFTPGSPAALTRALSGARDPSLGHRVAQANAPRFALADQGGGLMANGGGAGAGADWGIGSEDGLLIEPYRENRCSASVAGLASYGPGTGTRTNSTDPILGAVLRLNKTGGAAADRFGGSTGGASLNPGGTSYATGMLVRPYNTIGNVVVYTDAPSTPGPLITAIFSVPLARLAQGQWNFISVRGYVGGRTINGAFTTYAWLDGGTGGDCDIAQLTTTNGGTCWMGSTINNANTSAAADAPILTPTLPFNGASGMVVMRVYVPWAHRSISAASPIGPRVYWQRKDGADGIRVASEDGQFITVTMTNGGNTTTINDAFTGISAGWHTVAWRWDQTAGILAVYRDGALVSQTTGLAANRFPSGVVGGDVLLGHSGAGAENMCGAVGWVALHPTDPGHDEGLAATASADPRHTQPNLWNFRQRAGFRMAASDDGNTVLLPAAWHGVWGLVAGEGAGAASGGEGEARARRLASALAFDRAQGLVGALDVGAVGLRASTTPALGTINAGTEASFTVDVSGATAGMTVVATPPANLTAGISVRGAAVVGPNLVRVYLRNDTGGNLAPPAGMWVVSARKAVG